MTELRYSRHTAFFLYTSSTLNRQALFRHALDHLKLANLYVRVPSIRALIIIPPLQSQPPGISLQVPELTSPRDPHPGLRTHQKTIPFYNQAYESGP